MKTKILLLLFIITFSVSNLYATHNRCGQITYKYLSGLTYEITITTYTYSPSPADRPQLTIEMGDGNQLTLPRIQKDTNDYTTYKNIYIGTYTYNTPAVYVISLSDPNRNAGIINIPASVNVPFYIESMINVFDPAYNCIVNSVDFFSTIPMIKVQSDNQFKFNLTTYDPDHSDSISYELVSCKGEDGLDIPGYFIPAGVTLNPYNGEFKWNDASASQGAYCFAAKIKKWRNGRNVSYVLKDFMITVATFPSISYSFTGTNSFSTDTNGNYYITLNPNDTLNLHITYTDANISDQTFIQSFSEVYQLNNPAIYSSDSIMNISNGYFKWIPNNENGRKRPYLLTFRGNSVTSDYILHDLSLFIYVVGNNDTICAPFPYGYSINEINNTENNISIYPNPVTDNLSIESSQQATIEITNIEGQLIKTLPSSYNLMNIDVSAFARGMYFVKIETAKGVAVKKFIKE